jgi:hypothetical protein
LDVAKGPCIKGLDLRVAQLVMVQPLEGGTFWEVLKSLGTGWEGEEFWDPRPSLFLCFVF